MSLLNLINFYFFFHLQFSLKQQQMFEVKLATIAAVEVVEEEEFKYRN